MSETFYNNIENDKINDITFLYKCLVVPDFINDKLNKQRLQEIRYKYIEDKTLVSDYGDHEYLFPVDDGELLNILIEQSQIFNNINLVKKLKQNFIEQINKCDDLIMSLEKN
jgi:hypothetical protein